MLRCVRHEVEMRQPVKGSTESIRTQLARAAERNPEARLDLLGPQVPADRADLGCTWEAIQYLWEWFWEISRTRTYSPMTGRPDAITFPMLDAWARLTSRELWPHEVDALLRLDRAYLEAVAEFAPKRTEGH